MIRTLLLFTGLFFLVNLCCAQGNLTGRIYENHTHTSLPGISVQNLKSKYNTVSDDNGLFSIRAHLGDLIVFSGFSYRADTLYVKDYNQIEIFLQLKTTMLKGINVVNSEIKMGKLTAAPTLSPFGGSTVVYQKDKDGNYDGGLTAHIFDSHSDAKKRIKAGRIEKDEETKIKIDKAFGPQNLQNLLPIEGQEMENFIILYKPDIATFTQADFNLTAYIMSSYREFLKVPAKDRQSKSFLELSPKAARKDSINKP